MNYEKHIIKTVEVEIDAKDLSLEDLASVFIGLDSVKQAEFFAICHHLAIKTWEKQPDMQWLYVGQAAREAARAGDNDAKDMLMCLASDLYLHSQGWWRPSANN